MTRKDRRVSPRLDGLEDRSLLSMAGMHGPGGVAIVAFVNKAPAPKPALPLNGSVQGSYQAGVSELVVNGIGTAGPLGKVVATGTVQAASLTPGGRAVGTLKLLSPTGATLMTLSFSGKIPTNTSKPVVVQITAVNSSGVSRVAANYRGTGTIVIGSSGTTTVGTFTLKFNLTPVKR